MQDQEEEHAGSGGGACRSGGGACGIRGRSMQDLGEEHAGSGGGACRIRRRSMQDQEAEEDHAGSGGGGRGIHIWVCRWAVTKAWPVGSELMPSPIPILVHSVQNRLPLFS